MAREVLILAREGNRKGRIIAEGPVGKKWGKEELNTDKFVIGEIDDDETDFLAEYETGKTSLGDPDEYGVPTVVKEVARKYVVSEEKIQEILDAGGKKTIAVKDITDNEG